MCQRTEGTEFLWIKLTAWEKKQRVASTYIYEKVWCHGTFEDFIDGLKREAETEHRSKWKLDDRDEVYVQIKEVNSHRNSLPPLRSTWEQPPVPATSDPEPGLTRAEVAQSITGAASRFLDEITERT